MGAQQIPCRRECDFPCCGSNEFLCICKAVATDCNVISGVDYVANALLSSWCWGLCALHAHIPQAAEGRSARNDTEILKRRGLSCMWNQAAAGTHPTFPRF